METLTEGFSFDEETHTYSLLGKTIPSATQVISAFNRSYDNVPEFVLKRKAQIGTEVHEASCLLELGIQPEETDQTAPYLAGYRQYLKDYKPEPVLMETRYIAFMQGIPYGMTLDRLTLINGEYWIDDLKTSAKPHLKIWGLQLAGYHNGVCGLPEHQGKAIKTAIVHLKKDGTYKRHEIDYLPSSSYFRSALATYDFFGLGDAKKS